MYLKAMMGLVRLVRKTTVLILVGKFIKNKQIMAAMTFARQNNVLIR